tara:strand:- start:2387 stop:5539 length:3153 start_codon:yes stop_codon:yes gene_type:complete
MSYTASYIVNSSSAQGTTDFQFTFPYIKEEHIEVYLNYSKITQGSGSAQYQVITNVSPKLIRLNTGIASANLRVEVRRNSSLGTPLVDYADGSTLTANDLDTSSLQSLYIDQELKDNQSRTVVVDETTGLPELNNQRLTNVADPVAAQDAVTKAYLERSGSISSTQILDGTIVDADINASAAISGSKVQLASGSGPGALSTSDFVKLSNIETAATADQTNAEIRAAVEAASDSNVFTDADHTKLNAIEPSATADQTDAEIRTAVENATDSNVFTDDDHTKLNGIETAATADQTDAEIRTAVENATDSNVFTDADHSKLNGIETAATADQTASEIKTLLQSDKLTSSEIATGALDGRYYTETEVDANFYKLGSVGEIQSGETWSAADNKIATTAAIDARITDLVDDVGGFVPIANETSFPTANPDVNNGAGTLVSIKAFASSHTPSGGSVTIANGAGSGNTVTITGCGSTVLAAGFGGIVETTSTLHTYTFHRLSPKATEVTTVAGNITNINTVAGISGNVTTVAGISGNVTTVAGVSANVTTVAGVAANVTTVAGIASDVTAVANDATDIGAVAAKATEIGRLGTADAVADLNTLGTTAIVSDLDTCATNISNINTVGGSISNVNTVASNMSTVNDFADRYRVASSAPTSNNDEGDLYFDTTSDELRVYNGSSWQGGVTATGNLAGLGANTFTGAQTFIASQTFDGRDVSADGTKLDGIETAATADQTDAEIRTAVENANDSNVFTDADHTKLNGIETGATADQTATEIRAGVEAGDLSSLSVDGDVTFKGATSGKNIVWDKSDHRLEAANGAIVSFGDTNDLQIYHQGDGVGNAYIENSAGWLVAKGAQVSVVKTNNDYMARFESASVGLYSGGTERLQAHSTGVTITGTATATTFSGSGASLTSLNASNLSSGTIDAARVPTLNQDTTGHAGTIGTTATSANATYYPAFVENSSSTTGEIIRVDAGLSYNPSTNLLTAGSFSGDGSALTGIQAGATGGGNDAIFHENEHTVTTNYTITSGKNAISAGDISINNNISVTVPANRSWVVL